MFGIRTPTKQRTEEEAPRDPRDPKGKTRRSPTPVAHSSNTTSVRRSIGEWETGQPKSPPPSQKNKPVVEPLKPKPKTTLAKVEQRVETRRASTEALGNPLALNVTFEKGSQKYTDRLAEAKACLDTATEYLNSARNIKTEIKKEVTSAVNRLYQLVKEGVSGKKNTSEEKIPEARKLPEQRKEETELLKKLEEHTRLIHENNQRLEKLKDSLDKQEELQQGQSYASVAAAFPRRPEQTALHSVVVTAVDEKETGEEVLERIRKVVNAKETGIAVERIRKAKDRKIIVGCKTEEERQRIKEKIKGAKELNVEDIKNKDPMVILRDVLKYNSDKEVLDALKTQNKTLLKDHMNQRMEIAFKKRTRNPHTHHIVMRVSPGVWQCLVDAGSVLVDLQRVRVADQSPLVQCSLCLGYGHGRRFCKETVERCCHCGGAHMKTECADWHADVAPSCTNCSRAKLDRTDHNAFSGECPIRRKWEALARAPIAYC